VNKLGAYVHDVPVGMKAGALATNRDESGPAVLPVEGDPLTLSDEQSRRITGALAAHFTTLYRVARRLGLPGAIAEEAVQEAFIVFAQRIERVDPGKERAFLLGTVARITANMRRSACARHEVLFEPGQLELESAAPSQGALLEQKRARVVLDYCLSKLATELREVFVLYEIEQLTMGEIADTLGIKLGTATSRLHRAREEFERVKRPVLGGPRRLRGSRD
jgi:RNA polymerase sigma-70 factor, ECF subfamily